MILLSVPMGITRDNVHETICIYHSYSVKGCDYYHDFSPIENMFIKTLLWMKCLCRPLPCLYAEALIPNMMLLGGGAIGR